MDIGWNRSCLCQRRLRITCPNIVITWSIAWMKTKTLAVCINSRMKWTEINLCLTWILMRGRAIVLFTSGQLITPIANLHMQKAVRLLIKFNAWHRSASLTNIRLSQWSTISGHSLEVASTVYIARLQSLSELDITNFHSHPTMFTLQFENMTHYTLTCLLSPRTDRSISRSKIIKNIYEIRLAIFSRHWSYSVDDFYW